MSSVTDVPFGWRIYILTWFWLGILAGVAGPNSGARERAILVWAAGATAGWLLAETVRRSGWMLAVRFLAAGFFFLFGLWGVAHPGNDPDAVTGGWITATVPPILLIGIGRVLNTIRTAIRAARGAS